MIELEARDKIECGNCSDIISSSQIHFQFSNDWHGKDKVARFSTHRQGIWNKHDGVSENIRIDDDICCIPNDILREAGSMLSIEIFAVPKGLKNISGIPLYSFSTGLYRLGTISLNGNIIKEDDKNV